MHVMLDLETFGTAPGSVIRSIGAVAFDPLGSGFGSEFYANIDKQSCIDAGLKVDANTEAWWAKQSPEAQAALLEDQKWLPGVVADFNKWWVSVGGSHVWAQGSNFDPALWEAASVAVNARVPWKFWNTRDTRTAYEMGGLGLHNMPVRDGTYHNALDDAKYQVQCVQLAYSRVVKKKEAA